MNTQSEKTPKSVAEMASELLRSGRVVARTGLQQYVTVKFERDIDAEQVGVWVDWGIGEYAEWEYAAPEDLYDLLERIEADAVAFADITTNHSYCVLAQIANGTYDPSDVDPSDIDGVDLDERR
jgi:uncharacterized protein YdeI (YjbR/CyaY-like superfamily)